MKRLFNTILFLLIIPIAVFGQEVLYNKILDFQPWYDETRSTIVTLDGGTVSLCGNSSTIQSPYSWDSIRIVKQDAWGCIEWVSNLGLVDSVNGLIKNQIKQYEDGSFLTTHATYNGPNSGAHFALLKLDENGEFVWYYDDYGWEEGFDRPNDLQVLSDGGALVVGRISENSIYNGCLFRIDSLGNELWNYRFEDYETVITDSKVLPNGNYKLKVTVLEEGLEHIFELWTFDDTGNFLQQDVFELSSNTNNHRLFLEEFIYLEDGSFIVSGIIKDDNDSLDDKLIVAKLDALGQEVWNYQSEKYKELVPLKNVMLPDSSIIICDFRDDIFNWDAIYDSYLTKLDKNGILIWEKKYISPSSSEYEDLLYWFFDLTLMPDNTILVTGRVDEQNFETGTNQKIWYLRVDQDGNYEVPLSVSLSSPSSTLCFGDSLDLSLNVESTGGCYSVEWSGNGTDYLDENEYFVATDEGEFELMAFIYDDMGQDTTLFVSLTVEESFNLPSFIQDTLYVGESLLLDYSQANLNDFDWVGDGVSYLSDLSDSTYFIASDSGVYDLVFQYHYGDGCMAEAASQIVVIDTTISGINFISPVGVSVYPNPASNKITIDYPLLSENQDFVISNSNGQLLKEWNLQAYTQRLTLDITEFSAGLYFYQLGSKVGKLVIIK